TSSAGTDMMKRAIAREKKSKATRQRSQSIPLLTRLKRLSPQTFEHLIYDLLVRRGFVNVTWRTPGADGGRDLDADASVMDLRGSVRLDRWYVECKRYAVDWPTLREKIAFAENQDADYLLMCTTSACWLSTSQPLCPRQAAAATSRCPTFAM